MENASTLSKTISGTLLIAGTAIGAGMLAIPLATSGAGFFPALAINVLVWLYMLCTGLLLLRATLWMPDHASFLSLSRRFLGKGGETITGISFIFLYYCILIAYFAAGAFLFSDLAARFMGISLSSISSLLIFGGIFFAVVLVGPRSIDRVNIAFSLLMYLMWFLLIVMGLPHVEERLIERRDMSRVWVALPLLFGAFGYHNVIPSLTSYLGRDKKVMVRSIILGTTIPLVVYLFWQYLIIGAIELPVIEQTMAKGQPITFALEALVQNPKVMLIGQLFAFFAITTSLLGVSFSLVDFLADGFKKEAKGKNRLWLTLLTFAPPMAISITYPLIFEKALSIAGGFGETILNGLLPIALVYAGIYYHRQKGYETLKGGRALLAILTAFAGLVIGIEVLHLCGCL